MSMPGLAPYLLWREWRRHQRAVATAKQRAELFAQALGVSIAVRDEEVAWDEIAAIWWPLFFAGSETGNPAIWLPFYWTWEMLREDPEPKGWGRLRTRVTEKSNLLRRVERSYGRKVFPGGIEPVVAFLDEKHDEFLSWCRQQGLLPAAEA